MTIFLSSFGVAQNNILCGYIYYTEIKSDNFGIKKTEYRMTFNKKESFSEEINIEKTNDKKEIEKTSIPNSQNKMTFSLGRNNTTSKFFYNTINAFYFRTILLDESIIVKEDEYKIKWILSSETKKIGSFLCQKATTKFRGRSYIAWYSKDLPLSFGPWKLNGLPGLILEAHDTGRMLVITSNKLKVSKKNDACKINLDKKELIKALSILEYDQKAIEIMKFNSKRFESLLPKGFRIISKKEECEDCPKGLEIYTKKKIDSLN